MLMNAANITLNTIIHSEPKLVIRHQETDQVLQTLTLNLLAETILPKIAFNWKSGEKEKDQSCLEKVVLEPKERGRRPPTVISETNSQASFSRKSTMVSDRNSKVSNRTGT